MYKIGFKARAYFRIYFSFSYNSGTHVCSWVTINKEFVCVCYSLGYFNAEGEMCLLHSTDESSTMSKTIVFMCGETGCTFFHEKRLLHKLFPQPLEIRAETSPFMRGLSMLRNAIKPNPLVNWEAIGRLMNAAFGFSSGSFI